MIGDPYSAMAMSPEAVRAEAERMRQSRLQPQRPGGGAAGGALAAPAAIYGGYKAISPMFSSGVSGLSGANAVSAAPYGSGMLESVAAAPSPVGGFANAGAAAQAGAIPEAAGMFDLGGFGAAGNVYAPALGTVGAIDLLTHDRGPGRGLLQGAASGAAIGSTFGAPWLGAGIGGAIGLGKGLLGGHGKSPEQQQRDAVRAGLQQQGFVDQNWTIGLADGSRYDIGRDGNSYAHNVDFKNPLATQAVGWANPLGELVSGGDRNLKTAFAGYFANGAMSNAQSIEGVRANILAMLKNMGMDRPKLEAQMDALKAKGIISDGEYAAYKNGIDTLFTGDSRRYVMGPLPSATGPSQSPPVAAPGPAQQGVVTQLAKPPATFNPSAINPQTIDPGYNMGRPATPYGMPRAPQGQTMAQGLRRPGVVTSLTPR